MKEWARTDGLDALESILANVIFLILFRIILEYPS